MKGLLSILTAITLAGFAAAKPPNVIVILADDMGYGDIAAHGNPLIRTPHLDKLHGESARLTDFHVDPTCSPTRSALLTGRYSHRVKVWHTIAGGNHLRDGEMTMADVFRANGYRTGMFGKWHLGSNFPHRPIDRGFDEWLGQGDGGTGTTDDHFLNDRVNDHFLHNGGWEQHDGWAEDVFFRAATDFIRSSKKEGKPFFAYLCTYSPHHPITLPVQPTPEDISRKGDRITACFHAAIERIDKRIGELRAMLADEGIDRDTIIIFTTDNGGTVGVERFNSGMRGGKGDVYDGGHRVPCFIRWPGGAFRHGEDITPLSAHIDMLPTLVDLCGLALPREVDFDGSSLRGPMTDARAEVSERTLVVELQRTFKPKKWEQAVAMTSRWRLVNNRELYDIKADPGQKSSLIADHPDVVERLRKDFDDYWKEVTPGDRDRAVFIVGDERDTEVFLHPSDWYLPMPPWHHARVASGPDDAGDWHIRAARAGTYRFEVRRWPREADAPITGVPEIRKPVDAWDAEGPKPDLIYGNTKTAFKKLPVATVKLTVDGKSRTLPVTGDAKELSFDIQLEKDRTVPVKAELIDDVGKVLAGGYYVYCRAIGSSQ